MNAVPGYILEYLTKPFRFFRDYTGDNIRPDLMAGVTVAVILLPQALAFALIAELPPVMGLYAAVMASVVGALWGSSNHTHTGPTTAISLLVLSALMTTADPGTPEYIVAAGMLAFMAGAFQVLLGFARLGVLINFVSQSVVVGFSTGAACLIGIKELRYLLGLDIPSHTFLQTIVDIIRHFTQLHPIAALLGLGTIGLIVLSRRMHNKFPGELTGMILASVLVFIFGWHQQGLNVVGELSASLPPLTKLPLLNIDLLVELSTGALAIGAIGLVETTSIARSISTHTGQRLNSNQEFVGQGLANIAAGLFSGYACAGSFSRSAVIWESEGRTPLSTVFSGIVVLVAALTLGSFVAYLPRTALAAVLIVTAYRMIHKEQILRILKGTRGDALIMLVTFLGTLFLHIEFAVLAGIFLSFVVYIIRTSTPRVTSVLPDDDFRHFISRPEKPECPQLAILDILGDLYFGAATHVEQEIQEHKTQHPEQRFLLLRMYSVDHCDFSGIHMLERVVRDYREDGGAVFLMRVPNPVKKYMKSTGFYQYLGEENFLADDNAISHIFHRILDPAVCIYECDVRAFKECQNLPKYAYHGEITVHTDIPKGEVTAIDPKDLWDRIHDPVPPMVIDVREPREYKRSHIPGAHPFPLSSFVSRFSDLPGEEPLVVVCRGGRRSSRAVYLLLNNGYEDVSVLDGGMIAWEENGYLTAVEYE